MGFGIVPNKTSDNIDLLKWLSIAGFIFTGLGTFFGHLFAADKVSLDRLNEVVNEVKSREGRKKKHR